MTTDVDSSSFFTRVAAQLFQTPERQILAALLGVVDICCGTARSLRKLGENLFVVAEIVAFLKRV